MQHFGAPVGRIFAALHQAFGLQQIDQPHQGRPLDTHLFCQGTLPNTFSQA
jgi:hypothetical protein